MTLPAALAGFAALAGTALAGGPHPDPPPRQPPPPPPVVAQAPPPPVYIAPPPPPAVVHAAVRKHVRQHVARPKQVKPAPKPKPKPAAKPSNPARPVLAAAAPVGVASTGGTLSAALLIVVFGVVLALLAVGISFMPAAAMPSTLGLRLERSRQTILLSGLAVGVACALVGLLTAVAGP